MTAILSILKTVLKNTPREVWYALAAAIVFLWWGAHEKEGGRKEILLEIATTEARVETVRVESPLLPEPRAGSAVGQRAGLTREFKKQVDSLISEGDSLRAVIYELATPFETSIQDTVSFRDPNERDSIAVKVKFRLDMVAEPLFARQGYELTLDPFYMKKYYITETKTVLHIQKEPWWKLVLIGGAAFGVGYAVSR